MSTFIPRPDLQYLPPPYFAEKSRIASFLIPAANGSVQTLLDATLNAAATPAGQSVVQRFKPLLGIDQFLLTYINYPSLRATTSPWGYFTYQECAIFLPLVDKDADGLGTCWHLPFIVLDRCLPTLLGREVYGFPKMQGRLNFGPLLAPDWMDQPAGKLVVEVEGFAVSGAAQRASYQRLIETDILPSPFAPFDQLLDNVNPLKLLDFTGTLARPDFIDVPIFDFMQKLIGAGLPGIMLKEFPGVSGGSPAAYLRLLQAGFAPSAIHGLRYVRANTIFSNPASCALASAFGLQQGQPIKSHGVLIEVSWELPAPAEM